MSIITWLVIGVMVLAIIGLGWQTFIGGIVQGAQKIGNNPVIKNVTGLAKNQIDRITGDIIITKHT